MNVELGPEMGVVSTESCTFSICWLTKDEISDMRGREVMHLSLSIYAARSGVRRGLRACALCSQCRVTSTEAQDISTAAAERHASSWSAAIDRPVSKECGSRDFLLRTPTAKQKPANGTDSTRETNTARYYMDTQAMVRTLEENGGYSRQQAECLVSLLSTTLTTSLEPLVTSQVTRKDIELIEVQVAGEVDALRNSLVLLERSTIDTLRSENEALGAQIRKLTEILKEEVSKVQSGVQLDLNLEKGRLKEESTNLVQQIKDTNNRIETEVARLKTQIESQKLESIKYLAGGIFSVVTIVLSVMLGLSRLLK